MKLWLDDERPMPNGFDIHVKTSHAALVLLATGIIDEISLDHDLGDLDGDCSDGYEVACWIEEQAVRGMIRPMMWHVHSANPVGAAKMRMALENADMHWLAWIQS